MSASTTGGWPNSDCGPPRPRSAWRAVRWGDIRVAVTGVFYRLDRWGPGPPHGGGRSRQEPADALENPSERHSNRDVVDGISTASVRSTYPGGRRRLPKRMNHAAQILNRL